MYTYVDTLGIYEIQIQIYKFLFNKTVIITVCT